MARWMKWVGIGLVAFLAVAQFVRPTRTNPPTNPKQEIHANVALEPVVANVLSRSCNDCHSNRTTWPWYSQVAPASWLIVSDVDRGRKELNFSEWSTYGSEAQQERLADICKQVTTGEMPGYSYTLMHPRTKLSQAEVAAVCRWTQTSALPLTATERE